MNKPLYDDPERQKMYEYFRTRYSGQQKTRTKEEAEQENKYYAELFEAFLNHR